MTESYEWIDAIQGWRRLADEAASEIETRARAAWQRGEGLGAYAVSDELRADFSEWDYRVIAQADVVEERYGQHRLTPTLLTDSARPDQLWLAMDLLTPPSFWVAAGQDADAFQSTWSPYAPGAWAPIGHHQRTFSCYLGMAGQLRHDHNLGLDEIDELFERLAGLDMLSWGAAFDRDPWPERFEGSMVEFSAASREARSQRSDAFPMFSRRALLSGACVTVVDRGGLVCLEIDYTPCAHPGFTARLRDIFGLPFPDDLPMDAAMALTLLPWLSQPALREELPTIEEPEALFDACWAYAALVYGDLREITWLVETALSASVDRRRLGHDIASFFNCGQMRWQLLLREDDPARCLEILETTRLGGA